MRSLVGVALVAALAMPLAAGGATAEDAKSYISGLDTAILDGLSILNRGQLREISNHSRLFAERERAGAQFGETVFATPFGSCRAAGMYAGMWWAAARKVAMGEREAFRREIDENRLQYDVHKKACLEAAASAAAVEETEHVASTNGRPPRPGCLAVFGVKDGKVTTTGFTCPKK